MKLIERPWECQAFRIISDNIFFAFIFASVVLSVLGTALFILGIGAFIFTYLGALGYSYLGALGFSLGCGP